MKPLLTVATGILLTIMSVNAQISTPSQQIESSQTKDLVQKLRTLIDNLKLQKLLLENPVIKSSTQETKKITDSTSAINNEIKETSNNIKEILSKKNKFSLYGNASLATSESISDLNALTNILGVVNFHPKLIGAIGFNIKGVQPATLEKDSVNLNSLMFPDAGNAGFLTSLAWNILHTPSHDSTDIDFDITNSLFLYGDFAFKQTNFSIDTRDTSNEIIGTNKYSFSVLNYNLGFKYLWSYRPLNNPKNNVDISAQVYGNFFNVPNEDDNTFSKLYSDTIHISAIWSMGFKAVLSFRGVSIFGDFRGNLNTKNLDNANVFKGFVFNVGTRFSTEILGF